ncbi:MAG: bacteriophage abortive infection AbiH family protein [Roseburia sp.]|nr:bacteriophage abortive infection AbiH family protein [Roseburia sp.]MCM1241500.1 bacteriophage abortive infection AbiH family protein [Roseburia sp.]
MNITFLIGNGFDLNLGLHTRYSDFYPYFIEHVSNDNMIREWLYEDDLLWSDLEEQLGQKLQKLEIDNVEKFYEDKEELDELLLEYLAQEQDRLIMVANDTVIAEEFARSLVNFKEGLSGIDKESINETCREHEGENYVYRFISFNYTVLLDRFIDRVCEKRTEKFYKEKNLREYRLSRNVLHIHGTLEREMILGVNDISQVINRFLTSNDEFLDTFIKSRLNKNLGQRKTESVEQMINESDIICIFGLSIGCTDKMWWERILDWIRTATSHKLIVYSKDGYSRSSSQRIIRTKSRIKDKLIDNGNKGYFTIFGMEELKNNICVSYNPDIFNFKDMVYR